MKKEQHIYAWGIGSIDSHCKTSHGRRSVPKAHITCILPTSGRIPGHNEEIHLDKDVEDDHDVPGFEFGFWEVGLLSAPANDVNTNSHCEVKCGVGDDVQIVD